MMRRSSLTIAALAVTAPAAPASPATGFVDCTFDPATHTVAASVTLGGGCETARPGDGDAPSFPRLLLRAR